MRRWKVTPRGRIFFGLFVAIGLVGALLQAIQYGIQLTPKFWFLSGVSLLAAVSIIATKIRTQAKLKKEVLSENERKVRDAAQQIETDMLVDEFIDQHPIVQILRDKK